jgi:hypothetical protein
MKLIIGFLRVLIMIRQKPKKTGCILKGCNNKGAYSSTVKLIAHMDYEISVSLCTSHKYHFRGGKPFLKLDLKDYGKEELLGRTKDTEKQRTVAEAFDYLQKQAKANNYEENIRLLIDAAKHFAKTGNGNFLFGFYFGKLMMISSFRELLGIKNDRGEKGQRMRQIRSQMNMQTPYPEREHPDTNNELIEICRCGHPWFMHSGSHSGECYFCLCSSYVFEQKIMRSEISDLHSLLYRELRKQ